ncbi:MAG: penicillin acylase family protein [Chitinophagaceae bacterium]|nr:MAG: penicillin acylase family protein [Chitinophagaceae bacterium]
MRLIPFAVSALITTGLVFALNTKWGSVPAMGRFLSPQHGFWQNAEAADFDYNAELSLPGLQHNTSVYFDDRLVPHVMASSEHDVYYLQGYLHARFRLWQMEFQVFAAGGMVSHVLGAGEDSAFLRYDRSMRRLGMLYSAEKMLELMATDTVIQAQQDAYTAGVNAYIDQLTESELPIEYKLLDYKPERWTNLKSALFVKYISYDLAGHDDDLEYTNARNNLSITDFEKLFPVIQDSLKAIVPVTENNYPASAAFNLDKPAGADSLYFTYKKDSLTNILPKPDKDNGSNNWALAGSKTADGAAILCNDPHLGLNLPSIWYEMQLSGPSFNSYGVTFPGAPNIIIGYNDSIAFGVTNSGRDVKDYYQLKFRDAQMNEYWFDSAWVKTTRRVENIGVRGSAALADTVVYTVFGPVIYDHTFPAAPGNANYYAVRWKAQDPSNEMRMLYGLNHAKNYDDYAEAIKSLTCPGQNPVFASVSGDIAIWQQGDFPAKWRRQGDFIMPGEDSSYMWRGIIPQQENPHMKNPARGYVSSANQLSVDSAYPYYTGNSFPVYRGYIVNRLLDSIRLASVRDMQRMQTNNYNVKAEFARGILLQTDPAKLNLDEKKYMNMFRTWNLRNDPSEQGATVFAIWWAEFEKAVWSDELERSKLPMPWPNETTLIEALRKDSSYKFIDDINTPVQETLADLLGGSLKKAAIQLKSAELTGKLAWGAYKGTKVQHLLKLPAFSRLNLNAGGGAGVINATKEDHGPSWRMIVRMSATPQGYGIYPGGQSGNPGSRFYDNSVNGWVKGEYYTLWLMKPSDQGDKRIKWTMNFSKG